METNRPINHHESKIMTIREQVKIASIYLIKWTYSSIRSKELKIEKQF